MLLSKALRMQQDLEDKKHEVIIEGLESKIKDHEAALETKDFELQSMEGLLVEAQAKSTTPKRSGLWLSNFSTSKIIRLSTTLLYDFSTENMI
jgi:hypothetical protein